ncbi:NinF family protein, partial [Salmonella enterica]|nr:NinF family protein [Salmonella enterica]
LAPDEIYACSECVNEWLVYRDPNGDMSNEEGKAAL